MPERQIIPMPIGPQAGPGIAQLMPGADTKQARPVVYNPIQLQKQAPGVIKQLGGVLANPVAMAAMDIGEAQAIAAVGDAASTALIQFGEHVEKEWTDRKLVDANLAMQMGKDSFMKHLPLNPESWGEQWNSASREISEQILGDEAKLTPVLKQKLKSNFLAFDYGVRNSLDHQVMTHKVSMIHQTNETAARYFLETENMPEFKNAMAQMVSIGQIPPQVANMRVSMAERDIDRAHFFRVSEAYPHDAADEVQRVGFPPYMTPADQDKWYDRNRADKRRAEAMEAEQVANQIAAKPDMPEEEIRGILQSTHLGADDQEQLFQHWFRKGEPDMSKVNALADEIQTLTPDSTLEEKANVWKKIQTTTAKGTWLHEHLSESFGVYVADRGSDAYRNNLRDGLSQIDSMVEREKGKVGSALRDPAKANEAKLRTQNDFRAWLKSLEKQPTEDQVFGWLDKHGLTPPKKSRQEQVKQEAQTGLPIPAEMPWWKRQLTGW